MTQAAILAYMLEYVQKQNPAMTAEVLGEQNVVSLLQDSMDVVEFMMFMEDKLGDDTSFDLDEVRASFVNSNFRELAGEILRRLPNRDTTSS